MKNIIVITGASSGFGALAARSLAMAGQSVYASMRETTGRNAAQVEAAKQFAREKKKGIMKYIASISPIFIALTLMAPQDAHAKVANAAIGRSKAVKFSLINESGAPLVLKDGDDIIKLEPGKSTVVKEPMGSRLVVVDSPIQSRKPGDVIVEVSGALSGAIVHIK